MLDASQKQIWQICEPPENYVEKARQFQFRPSDGKYFKTKLLILEEGHILILIKNKEACKIIDLTNSVLKTLNHPKLGIGLRISFNNEYVEFYGDVADWYEQLRRHCIQHDFGSIFQIYKLIGKGTASKVYLVKRRGDQQQYAAKVFEKTGESNNVILRELEILRLISHNQCARFIEAFENSQYFVLVFEYISGPTLQKLLQEDKKFDEKDVLQFGQNLLAIIAFLHANGIAHRNVNPKNIILRDSKLSNPILLDFGHADDGNFRKPIKKRNGAGFLAPEGFGNQPVDFSLDVYSAGLILYLLLGGTIIDLENERKELRQSNLRHLNCSNSLKDILVSMIEMNPFRRIDSLTAQNQLNSCKLKLKTMTFLTVPNILPDREFLEDFSSPQKERSLKSPKPGHRKYQTVKLFPIASQINDDNIPQVTPCQSSRKILFQNVMRAKANTQFQSI